VEEPVARRLRPLHLICRSGWAVIAAGACGYFAYASCAGLRSGDFFWQHQLWSSLTWAVWAALAGGLVTETCCWRERILFTLLLFVFAIGLVMSLWTSAPEATVRAARIAGTISWSLAAVVGMFAIFAPKERPTS
jgi:hypothetical protein